MHVFILLLFNTLIVAMDRFESLILSLKFMKYQLNFKDLTPSSYTYPKKNLAKKKHSYFLRAQRNK